MTLESSGDRRLVIQENALLVDGNSIDLELLFNEAIREMAIPFDQFFEWADGQLTEVTSVDPTQAQDTTLKELAPADDPVGPLEELTREPDVLLLAQCQGNDELADLDAQACIVCQENKRQLMTQACHHLALCFHCAGKIVQQKPECPACRQPIEALLRVLQV